jgi:hypothetical protein
MVVWLASRPGRFTNRRNPVPIVQNAGWAQGPVWTCAKNLTLTGIRFLDRPDRSRSLYRLSYPFHVSLSVSSNFIQTDNKVLFILNFLRSILSNARTRQHNQTDRHAPGATQQTYNHALHRILSAIDPNQILTQQVQKSSLRMAYKCRNM